MARTWIVFAAFGLFASAASAQPAGRFAGPGVSLDVTKSLFDAGGVFVDEQGQYLGTFQRGALETYLVASARVPAGPVTVVAELPAGYADSFAAGLTVEVPEDGSFRGFGIGNPYLGVERQQGAVRVGLGVRAPLATVRSEYVGDLANAERPDAYRRDFSSVVGSLTGVRPITPALRVRGHLTPMLLVYTGEGIVVNASSGERFKPDPSFALAYGAQLEGDLGPARLAGGVVGFEESAFGGFGFVSAIGHASVELGGVRPGLTARTRLSDTGPPEPVVGFSLDVPLR